MWKGMEWFLEKMKLNDTDEHVEELQEEDELVWYENYLTYKRAEKVSNPRMFCKKIETYENAKEVIWEYKDGAECLIVFNQSENSEAQGMMNYICGGIYALGGYVRKVEGNVFLVSSSQE